MPRITLILIALFCGCAASPRTPAKASSAEVKVKAKRPIAPEAGQLSSVTRSRIAFVLRSTDKALAGWPWATKTPACVHLYGPKREWLLNCEGFAPKHFKATGERFGGQPVFVSDQPVTFYGKRVPFKAIAKAVVATVAFHWPQIPASAMFAKRPWFVIQQMTPLIANHPAFDKTMTSEEWMSILVHELFHLAQLTHPAVRKFVKDSGAEWLKNPGNRLKGLFAKSAAFAQAIRGEFAPLKLALAKGTGLKPAEAKAVLRTWLKVHRARQARFAKELSWPDLARWEDYYLFQEGVARAVEIEFLTDARYHVGTAQLASDPRFKGFRSTVGKVYGNAKQGRMRKNTWFYELGAHISRLLDVANPGWRADAMAPGFLVGQVAKL